MNKPRNTLRLTRTLASVLLTTTAVLASASELDHSDVGTYAVTDVNGQAKRFSLELAGDRFEIKGADPTSPLNTIQCVSRCDYRPTQDAFHQSFVPAQLRSNFQVGCVANSAFAFCKLTSKPLPECGTAAAEIGSPCRIGPPRPTGKPLYALFALFASPPAFMPVSRVDER